MDANEVKSRRGVYLPENLRISHRSTSYLDVSKRFARRQNIREGTLSHRSCTVVPVSPIKTGIEKILFTAKKTELNGRESVVMHLVESYAYLFRAISSDKKTLKIGENRSLELCNKSQAREKDVFKAFLKIVKDIEFGIDTKIYVLNIQGRGFSVSNFLQILRNHYKFFLKKGRRRKKIEELIERLETKMDRKNKVREVAYQQKIEWIRKELGSGILMTLSDCSKDLALEMQVFTPKILALTCPYFMDRESVLNESYKALLELEDRAKQAFGKGDRYIKKQLGELLRFLEIYTSHLIRVRNFDGSNCLDVSFSLMERLEKFPLQLYSKKVGGILLNLSKVCRVRKSSKIDKVFPEWNLTYSSSLLLLDKEQGSLGELAKKISRFFCSGAALLTTEDLLQGTESEMTYMFFEKSNEMLDWLKEHFLVDNPEIMKKNIKTFMELLRLWDKQGDFLTLSFMSEVLAQFPEKAYLFDFFNLRQRYLSVLEDPNRPAPTPPFMALIEELNLCIAHLDSFRDRPTEVLEDFFLMGEILETFTSIHTHVSS